MEYGDKENRMSLQGVAEFLLKNNGKIKENSFLDEFRTELTGADTKVVARERCKSILRLITRIEIKKGERYIVLTSPLTTSHLTSPPIPRRMKRWTKNRGRGTKTTKKGCLCAPPAAPLATPLAPTPHPERRNERKKIKEWSPAQEVVPPRPYEWKDSNPVEEMVTESNISSMSSQTSLSNCITPIHTDVNTGRKFVSLLDLVHARYRESLNAKIEQEAIKLKEDDDLVESVETLEENKTEMYNDDMKNIALTLLQELVMLVLKDEEIMNSDNVLKTKEEEEEEEQLICHFNTNDTFTANTTSEMKEEKEEKRGDGREAEMVRCFRLNNALVIGQVRENVSRIESKEDVLRHPMNGEMNGKCRYDVDEEDLDSISTLSSHDISDSFTDNDDASLHHTSSDTSMQDNMTSKCNQVTSQFDVKVTEMSSSEMTSVRSVIDTIDSSKNTVVYPMVQNQHITQVNTTAFEQASTSDNEHNHGPTSDDNEEYDLSDNELKIVFTQNLPASNDFHLFDSTHHDMSMDTSTFDSLRMKTVSNMDDTTDIMSPDMSAISPLPKPPVDDADMSLSSGRDSTLSNVTLDTSTLDETKEETRPRNRSIRTDIQDKDKQWMVASSLGQLSSLQELFRQHPDIIHKRDFVFGYTALHWAAKLGRSDIVEFTLNNGVDVNVKSHGGYTPLHIASNSGKDNIILQLVEHHADINCRDPKGNKPKDIVKDTVAYEVQARLGRLVPNCRYRMSVR